MKELIIGSIIMITLLFVIAGIQFRLSPFHLSFTHPYLALGMTFIFIGVFFIYYQGHINGGL